MIITLDGTPYDVGLFSSFSGATEMIEASIRVGGGKKFSQTWNVEIPTREYNNDRIQIVYLSRLIDVKILAGTTKVVDILDDASDSFQATFSEKKLSWGYLEENLIKGTWVSIFSVNFGVEKV